jgi:hypothetical protein
MLQDMATDAVRGKPFCRGLLFKEPAEFAIGLI